MLIELNSYQQLKFQRLQLPHCPHNNELDVAVENMIKKQTEIDLKIKAMQSIIRDFDKKDEIDKIKKDLSKFKKINSL